MHVGFCGLHAKKKIVASCVNCAWCVGRCYSATSSIDCNFLCVCAAHVLRDRADVLAIPSAGMCDREGVLHKSVHHQ